MAGVRQFDEQATFERALDVFWTKGFRATSMPDLAAGTGVQRGSLYHAYGGKEQLFLKVFEQFTADFLAGAAEALADDNPKRALTAFFDFVIASITTGTPSRGCLSTRTAVEADGVVEDAVRKLLDDLEELLLARLEQADLAVEPREAARLVVAMTRGLAVLERVYDDPARLRETAATLVTSLLR
ncbi:TetR family transcriptional regulator [Kribbella sp. ALI-6-A]|uniref:TetR/AcrR family transcriptional regulator n=1 Tax=Kribbella sp. ALI-6-A TaxID=1933817 RepID=UPI00097BC8A6|nr:TetR/AcrR family transcriptional regulator [Kribbella sp. ALI-6-A]ONI70013.1 TetR family transcriptional regulator [Kribbella sp. ALI-6-A]